MIIFATGNPHKVEEISRINTSISFLSLNDVKLFDDIPETGTTFKENALQKAKYVYNRRYMPVLAEDSGLVIDVLDGAPGVHSARFAGEEKDHQKNISKVLSLLSTHDKRTAKFVSTLCYIDTNGQSHFFEGECNGKINNVIAGSGGFGYDPIFIPTGYNQTLGELPNAIKDEISHRKKSFVLFSSFIDSFSA